MTRVLLFLLGVVSTTVYGNNSFHLANTYCKQHHCKTNDIVVELVATPIKGTCLVLTDNLKEQDFTKLKSSNRDWWLILPSKSYYKNSKQHSTAIEATRNFYRQINRQIYEAEPFSGSFKQAEKDFCFTTFELNPRRGGKKIGILFPKY